MSNIQTGAERMPHDLSHLGFLAGQIGRLITISTTPVIAGDSFEMDAVGALRLSPLRRGLAIDSTVDICLVRFESSSVPTTLPTAYDVYPLDGRHDGGYYTVKDCVTIDVLPRTPGNNVYVGFMVWSNFTATKCRGL